MESQRLKLKIGDYEFEAEGPQDVVQHQYKAFQELVMKVLTAAPPPQHNVRIETQPEKEEPMGVQNDNKISVDDQLEQIMDRSKKVVSLTTRASDNYEATLLLLYGQKVLRNNVSVTGADITNGLRQSGIRVDRVDRIVQRLSEGGLVIITGQHRGKRYRLTNSGLTEARELAKERIAEVA